MQSNQEDHLMDSVFPRNVLHSVSYAGKNEWIDGEEDGFSRKIA